MPMSIKKKMKYDVPSENIEEVKLSLLGVGKVRAFLLVSLKKRYTNREGANRS